jgi:splicing factor 3B subunit 1
LFTISLQVQERQNRVCTTVAIAIVAETCQPFTVLPAVMNEYRTPDLNVQNGVLKSLSFMFEYIGEMARDYVYAVAPLLEDALVDRDAVHRQTACATVKHLALGLQGLGCEDVLQHLLNFVWPNIFETSPHVIGAVLDAIEGLRVSLGPQRLVPYVLQGLFHPARRVREAYWKIYNNLYVYAADALTPMYPRLTNEAYFSIATNGTPDFHGRKAEAEAESEAAAVAASASSSDNDVNKYRRTYLELLI